MYLIFILYAIYARPPFPSPSTTTLAYVIRRSHTAHSTRTQAHTTPLYIILKNTQKKAQAANNYLDLLYVLKGFLLYLIHLTTFYHKFTQRLVMDFIHTIFLFISLNINLTIIIESPYILQITQQI